MGLWGLHHARMVFLYESFETVEVHLIAFGCGHQRILHHFAAVAFHDSAERSIYRRLNHHCIAARGKEVHGICYSFHHTGNKGEFAAVDFKTVAMAVPVYDGVPVCIGSLGVSQHRMLEPFLQCRGNLRTHGEVEVGDPQGGKVVAAEHCIEPVDFCRCGAMTVDNAVEVVLCH